MLPPPPRTGNGRAAPEGAHGPLGALAVAPGHPSGSAWVPSRPTPPPRRTVRLHTLGFLAFLATLLLFLLAVYLPNERNEILAAWQARLASLAGDRAAALEAWVEERLQDATLLATFPSVQLLAAATQGPPHPLAVTAQERGHLEEVFLSISRTSRYRGIYLLDAAGNLLAASPGAPPLEPSYLAIAQRAVARGESVLDFHAHPGAPPAIAAAAPVRLAAPPREAGRIAGAILLSADPTESVFPLLAREPVPTASGESVLVRRRGHLVEFLSPLRHRPDPPMTFTRPFRTEKLAAAAATRGVETVDEFVDYRGQAVLAATHPIRHTPWGLVVKVDLAEVLAPLKPHAVLAIATGFAFLLALATAALSFWRVQQLRYEGTLASARARFAILLDQLNDAVLVVGSDGRIREANRQAEVLYGYPRHELLGKSLLSDLHPPDTQGAARDQLATGLSRGEVRFETIHRRADGQLVPVEVNSRRIELDGGPAMLSVIRDTSERKAAEAAQQRLVTQLTTVHRVGRQLRTQLERQRLEELMIETLEELFDYELGGVLLLDEASGDLVPFAVTSTVRQAAGSAPQRQYVTDAKIVKGQGITGWVAATGESVLARDVTQDPRYVKLREDIRSELCVPMKVGETVIGVCNLEATRPDAYTEEDRRLLETLADQFAIAVHNTRLFQQVRELTVRLVEAEEQERRAVARELHDRVGQTLTALSLNLSLLQGSLPEATRERLAPHFSDMNALLASAAQEMRDVMATLRPPVLDDYGLLAALRFEAERFAARSSLQVEVHGDDAAPRPPAAVELVLFRAAQEALTNVAKHARASRVTLTLEQHDDGLRLEVADDGVGFDPAAPRQRGRAGGWGLLGIAERVASVGGTVAVESAPGKGTRVIIEVGEAGARHGADRR